MATDENPPLLCPVANKKVMMDKRNLSDLKAHIYPFSHMKLLILCVFFKKGYRVSLSKHPSGRITNFKVDLDLDVSIKTYLLS